MLKRLRWQLTSLYLLVALGLIALVGFGSYTLIRTYFQTTTDQAIQYKMATLFQSYSLPIPEELAQVQQSWLGDQGKTQNVATLPPVVAAVAETPMPLPTSSAQQREATRVVKAQNVNSGSNEAEESEEENDHGVVSSQVGQTVKTTPAVTAPTSQQALSDIEEHESSPDDAYDARLAPIFVLPVNAQGNLIANSQAPNPAPIAVDNQAASAALKNGTDWRTITMSDGTRVRLLSYRTSSSSGPVVLQVGRLLGDQDRLLNQYLTGLLMMAGAASILLGLGSWWLSGRSLGPAQRAWDQQHAFIANASHELRTPLTLIQATTEIGLRARPEEEQAGVLQDILDETGYMNQLVDDLLLLSRLDTRRLQLKRQVINLAELLQDVHNLAEKIAQPRQIAVQLGSTAGSIWGDPVRMRQVLLILIDNAIRFSPPGSAIRLETQAQGKYWNILVIDHGRGIPAKDLPHLFERFYQVQQSGDDMSRNSGLGLSIAKGLVEAQGGTIRLESQPDQGTRATLILPSA